MSYDYKQGDRETDEHYIARIVSRCKAIERSIGGEAAQESRALALLKWMVTEWDDEQSKRTQSIADEPWRIKQARKIIGGYVTQSPRDDG